MPENVVVDIQPTIPSRDEKERAIDLVKKRECPHCQNRIRLGDVISMLFGAGWDQTVFVQLPDGSECAVRASTVNTQTMRIIEPDDNVLRLATR
jgi:hypothetical protein